MSANGNPHLRTAPLLCGAPIAKARVVVILVHGRGQSPEEIEEHVARRIDLGDVAYVAPAAADRTWYPVRFMAPALENEPHLTFAVERLAALSDELAATGRPVAAQVLMGFSQGACLACELVYRRRRRFAALCAFTGGLPGPPGTRWDAAVDENVRDMPVLLGGSDDDPWVPASRMRETADLYTRLGARVTLNLYAGTEHTVRDEQIADARALLSGR